MEKRALGKSGLEVSAIGLGCMGLSGTTKPKRLTEDVSGASVVLTREDILSIEKALAESEIQGHRYSAQSEQLVDR